MAKSLQEFREWAVAQGSNIGNPQVGTYKGECVSLIQQYLYQVFGIPYKARGNAKDFVPPDFTKLTGNPKPGDILRYQPGKGGAGKLGHIGLVDDDSKFLNQNHNGDHKVYRDKIPAGYEIFRPNKSFNIKSTYQRPAGASDSLLKDKSLGKNESIWSQSGKYQAAMQGDGNFVVYNKATNKPIFATNTVGKGARIYMQHDSNLVIYNSSNKPVWASNTVKKGGVKLVMQNDGNLVMYTSAGKPVWASNTMGK